MPNPSFDTWTIIFLFTAIQGFFVSIVLLSRNNKYLSRKILATITLLFSVILIEYVLFWTGYQYKFPYLMTVPNSLYMLFGPLFYLYFKSIFIKPGFSKKDVLHFIPFVLTFAWFSPFIFKTSEEKRYIISHNVFPGQDLAIIIVWAGIVQMCIYLFLIHRHYASLSKTNPEVKQWFRWVYGFFSGFIISYTSYYILANFLFFNTAWDYSISFSMMFFIFFVAWFGYCQPKVFSGFTMFEPDKVKYKNRPLSFDVGKEIVENLEKSMSEKKYFLQSDLSLEKLSNLTKTNRHYLSQAINENLEMNFFEYINSLRITEACDLLQKRKDLTIIEIAYQVGYNNKVSFNKAFKNIVGQTPTIFRSEKGCKDLIN